VDDKNHTAARLYCDKTETILKFYSENGEAALEIGADRNADYRYVRLLGRNGRAPIALNSLPPHGGGTLYLGDDFGDARIVIGSLLGEMHDARGGTNTDWGLLLRRPGSSIPLFQVVPFPRIVRDPAARQ
jgi:hypothetical protein